MRRKDKEITDLKGIEAIINKAKVCRLALTLDDTPYIVPVCFGYSAERIYFHSAKEGEKVDIIKKNHRVCFEFDIDHELVESEKACNWGIKFRSVIGFGKASFVDNIEEKQEALGIIMQNYTDKKFLFPEEKLNRTLVVRIDIEQITGKKSGY
jgi:nitroimidazol reductase NimA-like FMN-containing flavoprotein (pyridoxamine 5'-phosphate oxidase superfamily)